MTHRYALGLFETPEIETARIDFAKDKGYAINQYNWYRKHASLKKVILYRDGKEWRITIRIDMSPRYIARKQN